MLTTGLHSGHSWRDSRPVEETIGEARGPIDQDRLHAWPTGPKEPDDGLPVFQNRSSPGATPSASHEGGNSSTTQSRSPIAARNTAWPTSFAGVDEDASGRHAASCGSGKPAVRGSGAAVALCSSSLPVMNAAIERVPA